MAKSAKKRCHITSRIHVNGNCIGKEPGCGTRTNTCNSDTGNGKSNREKEKLTATRQMLKLNSVLIIQVAYISYPSYGISRKSFQYQKNRPTQPKSNAKSLGNLKEREGEEDPEKDGLRMSRKTVKRRKLDAGEGKSRTGMGGEGLMLKSRGSGSQPSCFMIGYRVPAFHGAPPCSATHLIIGVVFNEYLNNMADSETSILSEAYNSEVENVKAQSASKRPSDAFSIEKLLSVTSSDICLRIAGQNSNIAVDENRYQNFTRRAVQNCNISCDEDYESVDYPYNRNSAVTSVVSADSSSVGLPTGYCNEEAFEEDEEGILEEDMDGLELQSPAKRTESVPLGERADVNYIWMKQIITYQNHTITTKSQPNNMKVPPILQSESRAAVEELKISKTSGEGRTQNEHLKTQIHSYCNQS
ncbi:hypothetical protein C0J52_24488 [Blattella germanica]|nr:hypothetical protein C0J52_24488 [Blattella germanica]